MAINLWKLAGKPTSYNPLPLTYVNFVPAPDYYKEYKFTFKAKSASNARLRVQAYLSSGAPVFTLTNEFVQYTALLQPNSNSNNLFLYDLDNKGDIIIEDIQLVQKPLPKLTINGIDGFLSGKWNLHSNTRVIDDETLELNATGSDDQCYLNLTLPVNQNVTLNIEHNGKVGIWDSDRSVFIFNKVPDKLFSFNTGTSRNFIISVRNYLLGVGTFTFKRPMLNLGTTPAPYSKKTGEKMVVPRIENNKAYVNKKPKRKLQAKTGLAFNGTTDYLQLPSMTMDSIEIDCLIDSVQPINNAYFIDARTGLANSNINLGNVDFIGTDWLSATGLIKGQRTKVKLVAKQSFTDDITLFARYSGSEKLKATLYKVTCYLNGAVVATYDFENPSNLIGDKVIPNAKNLIPSFEDVRWSLHANFKVLGKDVGRLEATLANSATSVLIPVLKNTNYQLMTNISNDGRHGVFGYDGGLITGQTTTNPRTFNTGNYDLIQIRFDNPGAKPTGTFDFIKPQLYELPVTAATLFGKPEPLRKTSKRTLTAKR
jgi:hypothetical protein